jgi:hypothetical protein
MHNDQQTEITCKQVPAPTLLASPREGGWEKYKQESGSARSGPQGGMDQAQDLMTAGSQETGNRKTQEATQVSENI